jgi:hypothetical protein
MWGMEGEKNATSHDSEILWMVTYGNHSTLKNGDMDGDMYEFPWTKHDPYRKMWESHGKSVRKIRKWSTNGITPYRTVSLLEELFSWTWT